MRLDGEGVEGRFIAIIVYLILLSFLSIECRRPTDDNAVFGLPTFKAQTILGKTIESRDLLGRYTLIVFGDPRKKRDLDLCQEVSEKENASINIVLITRIGYIPSDLSNDPKFQIIHDKDATLFQLFKMSFPGYFMLFDPNGRPIGAGENRQGYQEGPKASLSWHLHGRRFNRTMIIPAEKGNISDYPWLTQIERIIESNPKAFYLFGLFSSICGGCSTGKTILLLSKIRSEADEKLEVRAILSPTFEDIDISRLTSQLRLNFPIMLADEVLSHKWNDLNLDYRPSEINEIVFLVDSGGNIRLVFDPFEKDAHESFFHRCLTSLGQESK